MDWVKVMGCSHRKYVSSYKFTKFPNSQLASNGVVQMFMEQQNTFKECQSFTAANDNLNATTVNSSFTPWLKLMSCFCYVFLEIFDTSLVSLVLPVLPFSYFQPQHPAQHVKQEIRSESNPQHLDIPKLFWDFLEPCLVYRVQASPKASYLITDSWNSFCEKTPCQENLWNSKYPS